MKKELKTIKLTKMMRTALGQRKYTITLVGDEETGKTAYLKTLKHLEHDKFHVTTLDEQYEYEITVNDRKEKLLLLDTSGNEDFRLMIDYDVKMSEGVLLFCDCSNRCSLFDLKEYFELFESATYKFDLPVVLIVNKKEGKADEVNKRILINSARNTIANTLLSIVFMMKLKLLNH